MLPSLLLLPFLFAVPSPDLTWSQWRGTARDAISPGKAWPANLAGLKPLWRVELDKGYSSPIVAEDRVFVTESTNDGREVVRALNRATGAALWKADWSGKVSVPFYAKKSGDWIKSTPAYDGQTLFVGGMEEVLVALDAKTGKQRWKLDFPAEYGTPKPEFGFDSSPLLDGNFLYVQAADSTIKLNKDTGAVLWRSLVHPSDVMQCGAFSSPTIAVLAGRRQLLVQDRIKLNGVDLDSGAVLWSQEVPNFRGMNILTPVAYKDSVFTSSYQNNTYLYRVTREGDRFTVQETWKNKSKGYMSGAIIIGDHAYLHLGNQRLTCIDLKTGESTWTTTPFGQYWSMVQRGDKILALDDRGELILFRPNPDKFESLDTKEVVKSAAWGHLAVVGDELFIRDVSGISAFRWNAAQ